MRKRLSVPFPAVSAGHPPISELNTTPLIDVMLVLLVMFIITVPMMTHKVAVDLPQEGPPTTPVEPRIYNLDLDAAGAISLNGHPLTLAELPDAGCDPQPTGKHSPAPRRRRNAL